LINSAFGLTFESDKEEKVFIRGYENPAIYNITLTNDGKSEEFQFYTFFGNGIEPKEYFKIDSGQTKEIALKIFPRNDLDQKGKYSFNVFLKSKSGSEIEIPLRVNILEIQEAFSVSSQEIDALSKIIVVELKNNFNFNFNNIKVVMDSSLFEFESETFSLNKFEKKIFEIPLERERIKELSAGFYTLETEIIGENQGIHSSKINFAEAKTITSSQKNSGFLIKTKEITSINEGNVDGKTEILENLNIIERLFTSFNPKPDKVLREGSTIRYFWAAELSPGESFNVKIKTNWIIPLILIIVVVAVFAIARKFSANEVLIKKRISFVKIKGGEFGLKVSVTIKAYEEVENITVTEKIPMIVKLHEHFVGDRPEKIDEKSKKMEWNFDRFEKGEKRFISYIVYSKVGVLGRFGLPPTKVIYEKNGRRKEATSNRAFFLAEQKEKF